MKMNSIKPSTWEEKRLIKAIQKTIGVEQDGIIGESTLSSIASKLNADCWPLTISLYGNPTIITKNIEIITTRSMTSKFSNCVSGTFNDGSSICSICVTNSRDQYNRTVSCHYWDDPGYPESVMYKDNSERIGIKRIKHIKELQQLGVEMPVKWAIGGMGLLSNYDPKSEGFFGKFSDVLRKTNHIVLGYKNGLIYLCYVKESTGSQVNSFAKKIGLEYAIMLDGGHVAAINGFEKFSKINTKQMQLCIIKAI